MAPDAHPVLGIFASDHGPGDAERAALMSQVGSFLARKGARIVCLGDAGNVPVPLITSARTAAARSPSSARATIPSRRPFDGVTVEHIADREARLKRLAALSQIYVALPGSLGSATTLFSPGSAAAAAPAACGRLLRPSRCPSRWSAATPPTSSRTPSGATTVTCSSPPCRRHVEQDFLAGRPGRHGDLGPCHSRAGGNPGSRAHPLGRHPRAKTRGPSRPVPRSPMIRRHGRVKPGHDGGWRGESPAPTTPRVPAAGSATAARHCRRTPTSRRA